MFIWHFKIQTFFRYLNMYVSTQKFPQIFLCMSTTCCKSFKSFGEVGKKFFISNIYDPEISSPVNSGMSLTAPYSEVSPAIYNLFLPELLQYIRNMFKKSLNVYDTWFGFYGNFRKGTFGLPYEHGHAKWVKVVYFSKFSGLIIFLTIGSDSDKTIW